MEKLVADKFKLDGSLWADCGIHFIDHTGNKRAVARCPRYLNQAQWEEYSSFIVRSCNSHDELLAGCKDAKAILEAILDLPSPTVETLKAAIQKAEA
jgi:hypothetical protein